MGRRKTTEQFIEEARKVHGDKYDYSKVKYINKRTPVIIICPIHGEFTQQPCLHLKGRGCRKCASIIISDKQRKTTEQFIEEAKKIHGDKYDYSKVKYKNANSDIIIICPIHGEFIQRASSHLSGCGCPKCRNDLLRNSKEQFINEAKVVHGDKYDYSKVEYKNNKTKVCIICPKHGEFWQKPNSHIEGNGCPECALENAKGTKEEFIEKAKAAHGDKYDYSKVEYIDSKTKVCIICPKHGEFWQKPNDHIGGNGCPSCYIEKIRLNKEEFIERAKKIHGDKYDYSKIEYINNNTKICIICSVHGEFWQLPSAHLVGEGCPECFRESKTKTTEQFINEARVAHGNKYDYSKTKYTDSHTKVCIICPIHGEFWQQPYSHLNGSGCPHCNESKGEEKIRIWLESNNFIKGKDYIPQYRIDWLGNQSLDFFFPKLNIAIEYDGGQHFFSVEYFGGEKEFKKTQERDIRKNKLCKENEIKLIRISYIDYDNIEKILKENIGDNYEKDVFC